MRRGAAIVLAVAGLLLVVAPAASAATFTVNQTSDEDDLVSDGICDTNVVFAGKQCTLRAAIREADAGPSNDTINFSTSVFTGNVAMSTITLTGALPELLVGEVTINGRNCASSGTAKPCVGLDVGGTAPFGLTVSAAGVDIRGLAVTGATALGGDVGINWLGDDGTLKGSWIGIKLDGTDDGNDIGVSLIGDSTVIGGTTGAERNVFGYNELGLRIFTGDDNRVRGNYFGVKRDGTTVASNSTGVRIDGNESMGGHATGNVVGSTVSSSAAATTTCDGGCNVIASAGAGRGFHLGDDVSGSETAAEGVTIKGNFIGLDKTGAVAAPNSVGIELGDADGVTIGGDGSADRNYMTAVGSAISGYTGDNDVESIAVKRNYIGLKSNGVGTIPPPDFLGVGIKSTSAGPSTVSRNRFAGDPAAPSLLINGFSARIVRNKFGIDREGGNEEGGNPAIHATLSSSEIGEPGAGNTIGNSSGTAILSLSSAGGFGDLNVVQGNLIGVDSAAVARPNAGPGIVIDSVGDTPEDNLIGGETGASENVISNSGADAIRILDGVDNEIKRNRGKNNGTGGTDCNGGPCDLFIDLIGVDGSGNGGPNGGIDPPLITDNEPGDATRTHLEGGLAQPQATIYVFRTSASATFSPNRVNAFVKAVPADVLGEWSADFPKIPSGQRLTVLQIDGSVGSSELAPAVAP